MYGLHSLKRFPLLSTKYNLLYLLDLFSQLTTVPEYMYLTYAVCPLNDVPDGRFPAYLQKLLLSVYR